MSEQSEKIYINLVKNKDWKSPTDKLPVYVGPKNMKHPDKNWTIGVKEGEMTVILTPSGASKNTIANASSGGNNEYTF